jgi:hypothetical protein
MSGNTYLTPPNPIPGFFDFPGVYRTTAFGLYQPDRGGAPTLVVGWNALVSAFTAAMDELQDIPGAWADQSIAAYYLATQQYNNWRWSRAAQPQPVMLAVPYANIGDQAPPPFAANPAPAAALIIYAFGTAIPDAYTSGRNQGFW